MFHSYPAWQFTKMEQEPTNCCDEWSSGSLIREPLETDPVVLVLFLSFSFFSLFYSPHNNVVLDCFRCFFFLRKNILFHH